MKRDAWVSLMPNFFPLTIVSVNSLNDILDREETYNGTFC